MSEDFKKGARVRYTYDSDTGHAPKLGALGTVTAVEPTETGTQYAILWDEGDSTPIPQFFAAVLEPA